MASSAAASCCLQGCASVAAAGALETVTTTRGSDIMFDKDYSCSIVEGVDGYLWTVKPHSAVDVLPAAGGSQ